MSTSGTAALKALLHLLSTSPNESDEGHEELPQSDPSFSAPSKPEKDQLSSSLRDFRELKFDDNPTRNRKKRIDGSERSSSNTKPKAQEETGGYTKIFSNHYHDLFPEINAVVLNPNGKDAFTCLHAKCLQSFLQ